MLFRAILFPLVSMLFIAPTETVFGQVEDYGVRTVSVAGTASTSVMPDFVRWSIGIHQTDKNIVPAKQRADEQVRIVLALREELGVAPEDLETGPIRIRREYERDERGNQGEFKHFVVSRDIVIKQRDLSRLDEFLTKLLEQTELTVSFNFESSQMLDLRMDTWVEASKVAREKAQRIVEVHEAKLGKLLDIKESGLDGSSFQSHYVIPSNTQIISRIPGVDISDGTFAPGAISVKVTVLAVFEIVDGDRVAVKPASAVSNRVIDRSK